MPENYHYRSPVTLDLPTYRELQFGYQHSLRSQKIACVFICFLCLLFILGMSAASSGIVAVYCGVYLITYLIVMLYHYSGGLRYKQLLATNLGQPRQYTVYLCDDGIQSVNPEGAVLERYTYDQIRWMISTKNLIILVLPHKMILPIRKDTLQGGEVEIMVAWMGLRIPKPKHRRLRKDTAGKVLQAIMLAAVALTLVIAICSLPSVRLFDRFSTALSNDLSYEEMAQELAAVDITISQQTIEELEAYDDEYADTWGVDYYADNAYASKVYDLLYWEGCGVYDGYTLDWTPSTSGVFYFDMEVLYDDVLYTDFFAGLDALSDDLSFTDVTEDLSAVDVEASSGTVSVSFTLNGTAYGLEADYDYGWLDTALFQEVAALVNEQNAEKSLWVYCDGWSCLFYYGTAEQVSLLEDLTDLTFSDATRAIAYW